MIHRCAAHPTPRAVRLIRALLEKSRRPSRDIVELEPSHSRNAVGTDRVISNHCFMVAKVAIREPKHQPVTEGVQSRAIRLGHAGARAATEFGKASRR